MALFGLDIFQLIKSFLGPFGKLLDYLKQGYDHLTNIFSAADKLTSSIAAEVDAWRNFKQDVRFRQRVVNIETAVERTRDLIEGIPAAWRAILDIVKQFKEELKPGGDAVADAEAAATDIEAGGWRTLLTRFPALARGLEKVLGALALVIQALVAINNTIDDIQAVVDEITRLRLEVEKLDTIFLSQSNKRRTIKLADGGTMRIRVGKLHS